jgi:2-polyprenyl-6-methoxyphenol hydroxylase-like FAD-dependent oxidoreductase
LRVLIVGAGIAGLALARALRQRDITAEVVERATEWQPSGGGLYLPANAVRALGELGVEPALRARAPRRL